MTKVCPACGKFNPDWLVQCSFCGRFLPRVRINLTTSSLKHYRIV